MQTIQILMLLVAGLQWGPLKGSCCISIKDKPVPLIQPIPLPLKIPTRPTQQPSRKPSSVETKPSSTASTIPTTTEANDWIILGEVGNKIIWGKLIQINRYEAIIECLSVNMQLVSIETVQEMEFLKEAFREQGFGFETLPNALGRNLFWTSALKPENTDEFRWIDRNDLDVKLVDVEVVENIIIPENEEFPECAALFVGAESGLSGLEAKDCFNNGVAGVLCQLP